MERVYCTHGVSGVRSRPSAGAGAGVVLSRRAGSLRARYAAMEATGHPHVAQRPGIAARGAGLDFPARIGTHCTIEVVQGRSEVTALSTPTARGNALA